MRTLKERSVSAKVAIESIFLASLLAAGIAFLSFNGQGTATKSAAAVTPGVAQVVKPAQGANVQVLRDTSYLDQKYGGMFNAAHGNTPGPSQHEDFNPITGAWGPFGHGSPVAPRMGGMFHAADGNTAGPSQHEDYNPTTGASGPFD